jgi:Leucine-rich repeat (LRR) protein
MRLKSKLKIIVLTTSFILVIIMAAGLIRMSMLKSSQTYYDELDDALDNAEKAETLVMRNRGLKSLPSSIGNLTNLKVLNIGNNELTELPPEIGQLHNLVELSVESNSLTSLPKELLQLTKLKKLNLCINKLKDFPSVLPSSIEEIYLSANGVVFIPNGIRNLKKLRIIDLADNEIEEIPWSVVFPDSVQKIDLYHNKLTRTTPTMFALFSLKELILEENPLDKKTEVLYEKFKHR